MIQVLLILVLELGQPEARYLEGERVSVFSQLLHQAFLKMRQTGFPPRRWREHLAVRHKQVFSERQAENVQIFSTVTERTGQGDKHWGQNTDIWVWFWLGAGSVPV